MDWYEPEVRLLERTNVRLKIVDPVVFYGSSTFRLWQNLAADLGNSRAVNLGFGGSTLAACVHYFDRLVPPVKPCSLVVYAGDNDLGDGCSAEDVVQSFRDLSAKVSQSLGRIEMAFISIKPSPARLPILDRIQSANAAIEQLIAAWPNRYFINVYSPMLDGAGKPRRDLFESDGLHMNRSGYELWTRILSSYRNRIFTTDCASFQGSRVF